MNIPHKEKEILSDKKQTQSKSILNWVTLLLSGLVPPSRTYPDVLWVLSLRYPHHPQELVDVVARVADHPSEDDEHVVHIQRPHDLVGCALIGRHGFPHLQPRVTSHTLTEVSTGFFVLLFSKRAAATKTGIIKERSIMRFL